MISIGHMERRGIISGALPEAQTILLSCRRNLLQRTCWTMLPEFAIHIARSYNISSKKKSLGEIAMSVDNEYLMNVAMHEGFLAQSNNLLYTGVDIDELIELEEAIHEVEHVNGSTYTDLHGDLRMNNDGLYPAAAQRGWNSGLYGAAALTAAVGGGGGGDDHCAMGGHICDGVERAAMPERWPFLKTPDCKSHVEDVDDTVSWARTLAMKRMIDKMLTESARKKACTVQTALAKNDDTYVSIVKKLLPTGPGSQDVLDVCLMQASIDMK
jgi:hypothetical protein